MRKTILMCSVSALLLFLTACKTSNNTPEGASEEEIAYRDNLKDLNEARKEIKAKRYIHAKTILKPLLDNPRFKNEAGLLLQQIDQAIKYNSLMDAQELSGKLMLDEVEGKFVLPEKYNSFDEFIAEVGPFELAEGAMEKLLQKKVSLNLENADLPILIKELAKIDGVNIIADDTLTTDKTLTVIVEDVPLKEIFEYIERNMELSFHMGQSVIWVSQGEDLGGAPKLYTQIIRLKKGYIPKLGGGGDDGGDAGFGEGDTGGSEALPDAEGTDDLEEVLTTFLDEAPDKPEDAKFKIYRNRNILVIHNTRENIRLAQELVESFDRDPLQVLIEARYMTISSGDLDQLGTEISRLAKNNISNDRDGEIVDEGVSISNPFSVLDLAQSPSNLGLKGTLNNWEYDITLAAMKQLSSTKTLTAPRVTVLNNHVALMRQGDERYYYEEFDVESTTGGDFSNNTQQLVPEGEPEKLELGVTLQVLPSISNDGKSITMAINSKIIDFQGFEIFGSEQP